MRKTIYFFRDIVLHLRLRFFRMLGMDIDLHAKLSLKSKLDFTYAKGIHIGKYTYVGGGSLILSNDFVRHIHCDTYIGDFCFIGMNSVILPGVHIGNHSIVGAGAIVTKDVPPNVIVAGNPAKIIRNDIDTGIYGVLKKQEKI